MRACLRFLETRLSRYLNLWSCELVIRFPRAMAVQDFTFKAFKIPPGGKSLCKQMLIISLLLIRSKNRKLFNCLMGVMKYFRKYVMSRFLVQVGHCVRQMIFTLMFSHIWYFYFLCSCYWSTTKFIDRLYRTFFMVIYDFTSDWNLLWGILTKNT